MGQGEEGAAREGVHLQRGDRRQVPRHEVDEVFQLRVWQAAEVAPEDGIEVRETQVRTRLLEPATGWWTVVVVDHGDGASAARAAAAGAVAIHDPSNPGFGTGQNRGIAFTGSEVSVAVRQQRRIGVRHVDTADVRPRVGRRHGARHAGVVDPHLLGRLDVVVANAGVGAYGPFLELDPEELEAMIDVNLKGTLYTAAATLPHLIASGAGDFVSLASVAGVRAFPGEAVYNASKFGQVGFVRSLDIELREHGVRCSNICPGGVATDFAIGTGRSEGMAELARRRILSASYVPNFSEQQMRDARPYLWQYPMSVDQIQRSIGRWVCARLAGALSSSRPPPTRRHAGSPRTCRTCSTGCRSSE